MTEIKLGDKHICSACGTKFYDFGKPRRICPSCGTDQDGDEQEDTAQDKDD